MMMLDQENPRKPRDFLSETALAKSKLKQRKRAGKTGKTTSEVQRVDEQEKEKNPTWGAWDLSFILQAVK